MRKLAGNMCLTQCSSTLKILHLLDVVVAYVWGLVLPMYSLRYNLSDRLHCFSWVSPQLPECKNEAVLGPSVDGAKNAPGVELHFAKKTPIFKETVASPDKLCDVAYVDP